MFAEVAATVEMDVIKADVWMSTHLGIVEFVKTIVLHYVHV